MNLNFNMIEAEVRRLKRRLRKTFSSLLVSYMVTMVFTVSVGIYTYYGALNVVEKDAVASNLSMLKQSSEVIDTHLKEVENVVNQVGFDPRVVSFLNTNLVNLDSEYYKAIETWNYIKTYRFASDFIYNFYLCFNNSDMIMSPKDISFRLPMYVEASMQYPGMSYEQWYTEFMEKFHNSEFLPAQDITINGKTNSYITYLQSIPIGFKNIFKGTMVVLISEDEVHKLLNRLNLQEGGWSFISDANGKVISSITDDNRTIDMAGIELAGAEGYIQQEMDGEDMLLSYYTSPVNKWKYVSAIPTQVVMKRADSIRKTNTLIIALGLMVGMLIAVFFANRHSKPIRALIKKFGEKVSIEHGSDSNEYNFLDHSISRLIHNNEALHSEIDKQTPLLRAALFDRLFRGEFNDNDELVSTLSDMGIEIDGRLFTVIVLQLEWLDPSTSNESVETIQMKRVILKDLLSIELGNNGFIHDLRQERMAILMNFSYDGQEKCIDFTNNMVENLNGQFNKHSDIQVVFGIGCLYGDLLDVYRSFKEALTALESVNSGRGIYMLRYDDIPKDDNRYYYPLEIEQRIMNLVKSGNEGEISKLLQGIHQEIMAGQMVSSNIMKLLVFDISATIYKLIHEIIQLDSGDEVKEYGDFIERVSSYTQFQDAYTYMTQTIMSLCRYVNNQKKSHNVELKDQIIGYINNNYEDGSLCLASVSSFFGISEVYMSQFFKEQTGENFSTYMENTRMSRARDLLMKENLTVEEIARQVGYLNTNTFYKAFKRIEGVSPGKFRNQLKR
jgi:two-component system response regulator YesN